MVLEAPKLSSIRFLQHMRLPIIYCKSVILLAFALILLPVIAFGQTLPKPLVVITGIDDSDVRVNVQQAVRLFQLVARDDKENRVNIRERPKLVTSALAEIQLALQPFGYYKARVSSNTDWERNSIEYLVDLGEPVLIKEVDLMIHGEAANEAEIVQWQQNYPLVTGERLIQPIYDDAKQELVSRLRQLGYFQNKFIKQAIELDKDKNVAVVRLHLNSGNRYRVGGISVAWQDESQKGNYNDDFVRRYITLKTGDYFDDRQLQAMQSGFAKSGYFSISDVRPAIDNAQGTSVPITVNLATPKRYSYGGSVGFGTDSGVRAGLNLEDRRINRNGHKARVSLSGSDRNATAIASYHIPQRRDPRSGSRLFASYVREDSDTRDSETLSLGVDVSRALGANSQASAGLSYQTEEFEEDGVNIDTTLLLPKLSWQTISADNIQNPRLGFSVSAALQGASDDLGSDISFLQLNLNAKGVFRFGKNRALGRVTLGQTLIDDGVLPESFTYLAGGDFSVRGYSFESIGVTTSDGFVRGGENTVSASVELERTVWRELSVAAFIDAGDAYDDTLNLNVGAGVGLRWRLPFGAVRVDVAQAQDLPGKPSRVHFTFGADL